MFFLIKKNDLRILLYYNIIIMPSVHFISNNIFYRPILEYVYELGKDAIQDFFNSVFKKLFSLSSLACNGEG